MSIRFGRGIRRGLRPGLKQGLKNQFNRMIDERRRAEQKTSAVPQGQSILDQENPVVTPIIQYRCMCVCGDAWLADSPPTVCTKYPVDCKNPQVTYSMITDPTVRS